MKRPSWYGKSLAQLRYEQEPGVPIPLEMRPASIPWNDGPPEVPGWYFWCWSEIRGDDYMIMGCLKVVEGLPGVLTPFDNEHKPVSEMLRIWAGPLPQPSRGEWEEAASEITESNHLGPKIKVLA